MIQINDHECRRVYIIEMHPPLPLDSAFQRRSLGTRRFSWRSSIDRASSPRATAIANSSHRPRKSFLPASKEVRTICCRTMGSLDVDTTKTRKLPAKSDLSDSCRGLSIRESAKILAQKRSLICR